MEDEYQKIIDEENNILNERIAKIDRHHNHIKRNIYIAAIIIIIVTNLLLPDRKIIILKFPIPYRIII
jgi:hypothetical protein